MPDFRVGAAEKLQAFTHTSVDAAGPFFVKVLRSQKKVWLLVFACLTYQAVHLEVIDSLDTETFLKAFKRFTARRGIPRHMHSDNGGNFDRGSTELARAWYDLSQKVTQDSAVQYPQIEWTFSPPLAPHCNGVCERMVGAAKRAMKATMQPGALTENDFLTYVIVVEGILNTRPLGYVSSDPDDLEALTPNHFLRGRLQGDITPQESADWGLSKKLEKLEELQHQFWQRYVEEVVPSFHQMNKWTTRRDNFAVNDVVATADKKVRGRWPLAKVTQILPDGEGVVRQVEVLQQGQILRRHVGQLLLLAHL